MYHKKLHTWLRPLERIEKDTNSMTGTFESFEIAPTWCIRKKMGFKFDFEFLE